MDDIDELHCCSKCTFIWISERYTTKCKCANISNKTGEVDLAKCDTSNMDAHVMEEFLIKCGTLDITYTSGFHITSLQESTAASPQLHKVNQSEKTSTTTENASTDAACPSAGSIKEVQNPTSTKKRKQWENTKKQDDGETVT